MTLQDHGGRGCVPPGSMFRVSERGIPRTKVQVRLGQLSPVSDVLLAGQHGREAQGRRVQGVQRLEGPRQARLQPQAGRIYFSTEKHAFVL